jgi:HK97 family phage major capsid protein
MALTSLVLTPEDTNKFVNKMKDASAIMKLATYIPSSGNARNKTLHDITDTDAHWQTAKGGTKVIDTAIRTDLELQYYPLYKIYQFDEQEANDATFLVNMLIDMAGGSIGNTFDKTIVNNIDNAPSVNFDYLDEAQVTEIDPTSIYTGLANAYKALAAGDFSLNGWIFSNAGRGTLVGALDGIGHPLFDSGTKSVLGERAEFEGGVFVGDQIGIAGDWTRAVWGDVSGITIKKADNGLQLLQSNSVAVRIELLVGFRVIDLPAFTSLVLAPEPEPPTQG